MEEVLAKPDALERFIDDVDVVQKIRNTFAGFYELEMVNLFQCFFHKSQVKS